MRTSWPLVIAGVLCFCQAAAARDVFVDNRAGDDRFLGRQPVATGDGSGPVRSIGRAVKLARPGDRIVIANTGVPYRESFSLVAGAFRSSPEVPMVILGNGAVLDGTAEVPRAAWRHYEGDVYRFRPPRVGHQQLILDDRPATRVPAEPAPAEPPPLDALSWCLHGGYIYFAAEPGRLPYDYDLRYAEETVGITLWHVAHVAIFDLVVQGFQLDGVSAHNSAQPVRLVGVTSRRNGRSGVAVGAASLLRLDACLLDDNAEAQLLTLPLSETYVTNSDLLGDAAPAWVDRGGRVYFDGERVEGGRVESLLAEEEDE